MDTHTLNDRDVPPSPSPRRFLGRLRTGRVPASPTPSSPSPKRAVPAGRPRPVPVLDGDEIAPVPVSLAKVGVWAERTIGQWPLAAPLLVSGYFTYHVGTDGLNLPPWVAFCLTSALEGGLWRLVRIAHRTLLLGDSTATIRAGIAVYVAAISGIIYWHANATGADWRPAAAVAGMSALGVYIAGRATRLARRVQLHARGLVDAQMPKFSVGSWLLHPMETFPALRHAVRYRIEAPDHAFADRAAFIAAGRPGVRVFLRRHPGTWTPIPWASRTGDGDTEEGIANALAALSPSPSSPLRRPRPIVASPGTTRELSPSPHPSSPPSPGDGARVSPSRALTASPGTSPAVSPSRDELWSSLGDVRRGQISQVAAEFPGWEANASPPKVAQIRRVLFGPDHTSNNVAGKVYGHMQALIAAGILDAAENLIRN